MFPEFYLGKSWKLIEIVCFYQIEIGIEIITVKLPLVLSILCRAGDNYVSLCVLYTSNFRYSVTVCTGNSGVYTLQHSYDIYFFQQRD